MDDASFDGEKGRFGGRPNAHDFHPLWFFCVGGVLTGMPPVKKETSRQADAAKSAAKPWYFSSLTMSMPTALMMR